jgi:uncharacterized protein YqjF (DUF2071 family)
VTAHDFKTAIVEHVARRPWKLPDAPWLLAQTWHDLLFALWPVPPQQLRPAVPREIDLDLFDGSVWIGIRAAVSDGRRSGRVRAVVGTAAAFRHASERGRVGAVTSW